MKRLTFEKAAQAGLFGEAFVPSYPDADTDPHELFKVMKSDIILGRLDALGALEVMEKLFEAVMNRGRDEDYRHVAVDANGLDEIKDKVVAGYKILAEGKKSVSDESDTVRITFTDKSSLDIYFEDDSVVVQCGGNALGIVKEV
jgi:hypothetical protein